MKRLAALSLALLCLTGARSFGEDALGRILDRVYVPEGGSPERIRQTTVPAKVAHVVTENEIIGRLEKELAKQFNADGELRLSFGRTWQSIKVPSEEWELALPEMPIGGLSKSFLLKVRINADGRAWFDQQVVVQAQLWKPVLVTSRRLDRGQSLDQSAVDIQTCDVLRDRVSAVPASVKLDDLEILQAVAEGRILTWKDVSQAPLVRKGAVVEVTAGDGKMSISMKGMAMTTGAMGDAVTVRNMDTRKDFQARVVNRNSVRVTF